MYKRKSNLEKYSLKYFKLVFAIALIILSFFFLYILFNILNLNFLFKKKEPRQPEIYKQTADQPKNEQAKLSTIYSNKLLVKLTKESKAKIKANNPKDTGIESLNQILSKHQVKEFAQIVKRGNKSLKDHELFQWYKLSLDMPELKVKAKFNQQTRQLTPYQSTESDLNGAEQVNTQNLESLKLLQFLIDDLSQNFNIDTLEPNFLVYTTVTPNDPYYASTGTWGQFYADLWGIQKINLESVWDQITGSADIVVAVIDTGLDRNHLDIVDNIWINPRETPENGIDDDLNGYVDDYYGWDFVSNDNDPLDDHGHGTHCSGTIAATGNNNLGVVGVNWTAKIMALKFLDFEGSGSVEDAVSALQYAADNGARISSNSWGGEYSQAISDAIKYEHDRGMVIIAAAGNQNEDSLDYSPGSSDYAITVAAIDYRDYKAYFSNWGEKLDVSAPGVDILSLKADNSSMCGTTIVGTNYCRASGTSMAAPHVAGISALFLAQKPSLINEEIRQILRLGADDLGEAGKDRYFGYGRINALKSFNLINTNLLAPVINIPSSRAVLKGKKAEISGTIYGTDLQSYLIQIAAGREPQSEDWILITENNSPAGQNFTEQLNTTLFPDGNYTIRLTAINNQGKQSEYQIFDIEFSNNIEVNIYDVNQDQFVNNLDVVQVLGKYFQGFSAGDLVEDINKDGIVNIYDIGFIFENWKP